MGEVILIVDSDTIVPEVSYSHVELATVFRCCSFIYFYCAPQDCFRDATQELAECPEDAIIQHDSGAMSVSRFRPVPNS